MVIKLYYGQVLGRPAEDLTDFTKLAKVLLNCILLVEGWRHIPALDGVAVSGRSASHVVCKLAVYTWFHWSVFFRIWVQGIAYIWV